MLVAIWLIVTLTSGISQLNTAQSEHLNGWRYILIELLTTLFSPFLGFALLSEKNSDEYSSFTYNLFPQEMIPTIMALYAICIIGYWVIKLNRALLAQTSYLLIFSLLVWVL
ncbi:MAG: hypothetical protein SGJ00_04330, partial [bacterium]|nr:hypothetical protein [bacterium]